jgi:hypothetical protein
MNPNLNIYNHMLMRMILIGKLQIADVVTAYTKGVSDPNTLPGLTSAVSLEVTSVANKQRNSNLA